MLDKLEQGRQIALSNPSVYSQIVPEFVKVIGPAAPLSLRRWGSSFVAEALAYPTLSADLRQALALDVLQTVKDYLNNSDEDIEVVKFSILAATSLYPLIFKYIINNSNNANASTIWDTLVATKKKISERYDSHSTAVRVCCIKYFIKVVQTQTAGMIQDPRRPEQNEPSLTLVPNDHPLLSQRALHAEAAGLLDRVLSVFQETTSDAIFIDSAIMSLSSLVRARPATVDKVFPIMYTFNPFSFPEESPRIKVMVTSMERTLKAFFVNWSKRNPNSPMLGAVQNYLGRLQSWKEMFYSSNARKRAASSSKVEAVDEHKRQRLDNQSASSPSQAASTAPKSTGAISLADMWSMTDNSLLRNFDVNSQINGQNLVSLSQALSVVLNTFSTVDKTLLDEKINAVRARWLNLKNSGNNISAATAIAPSVMEDDDEEEYVPEENIEQVFTRTDQGVVAKAQEPQAPNVPNKPFKLPKPVVMPKEHWYEVAVACHERLFDLVQRLPEASPKQLMWWETIDITKRKGFFQLIMRLATRPRAGLEPPLDPATGEDRWPNPIGDDIRERLLAYFLVDWRPRMDTALDWMMEEWYCDQIRIQSQEEPGKTKENYPYWLHRLWDSFATYLDGTKDKKTLTIFLSEIPALPDELIEKVKKLAMDPERVNMVCYSLHYLIKLRPPVKKACLDALEDMYHNYDDAKAQAEKLLKRFRPQLFETADMATKTGEISTASDVENPATSTITATSYDPS